MRCLKWHTEPTGRGRGQLQNGSASDRFQLTKSSINVEIGRWRSRSVVECSSRGFLLEALTWSFTKLNLRQGLDNLKRIGRGQLIAMLALSGKRSTINVSFCENSTGRLSGV